MIERFQYITHSIAGLSHEQQVGFVCKGGCRWVQLRMKGASLDEIEGVAIKVKRICDTYDARLIINDNVSVAKSVKASGVHLGGNDMSVVKAREILGDNYIIGGTANTYDDVMRLYEDGVDYVGLGPFRYTETKENISTILGLEGYEELLQKCKSNNIESPIIAIGGIRYGDVHPLMETGIHGIAVSSVVHKAKNIVETTSSFINTLKK